MAIAAIEITVGNPLSVPQRQILLMQDSFCTIHLLLPLQLVAAGLRYVQTKTLRAEVHLVVTLLQDAGDCSRVLEFPEVDVTAALLDGVSDQLCGTGLTLGADNRGLLLLTGLVDYERCSLCVLLCDLLCLDSGGELGGKGKMLSFR